MNKKNIYLLKMGMDLGDGSGFNHRIRFAYTKENGDAITIDFCTCTPYKIINNKTVRGVENSALMCDAGIEYGDGSGCYVYDYPKNNCYYCHDFDNYLIYNYQNILQIINNITNGNYNNIILLEARYLTNFDSYKFNSCNFILDEAGYNLAKNIEEYAKNKIKKLRLDHDGSKYDNTSYYFDGDIFKILIHYNCYNDIIKIAKNDDYKKIIDNYSIPFNDILKAQKDCGLLHNNYITKLF